MSIGETYHFPLEIVDPDDDALTDMTVKITCNPGVDSFSQKSDSALDSSFTLSAKASDAGQTYTIKVELNDYD